MPDLSPTEDIIKAREENFSFIADYIPTLVWMANADGWIYWYNRSWYEYTGTQPKQMEGWGWQSVHDPTVLPSVLEAWSSSIATGKPFEMVFPLRGADGIFRPFVTRANTIRDSEGKILRWIGTNTNIASQRQAEALLVEKDTQLRAAFRQTYSFMALLSIDGNILEANDAALQAIASNRDDVIGKKLWEAGWWSSLPDEVETLKAGIQRAAKGESVREECRYKLFNGEIRFTERTLNPVKEEGGAITMVVASGIDITEQMELRRDLEQRVRSRTKDLIEKNELLRVLSARLLRSQDEERRRLARDLHDSVGQLLAAVAMNISVVKGQSDKLDQAGANAVAENQKLIAEIGREIRTLSHLLHPPLLDELGLKSALQTYVDGYAARSNIKVDLTIARDFGRLTDELEIVCFRIVQECLTNIHRHSKSETAEISIGYKDGSVLVEVRDKGKGIPQERLPELSSGGAGVGLAGMRERAGLLGGTLEIKSDANGTTVFAALPLKHSNIGT